MGEPQASLTNSDVEMEEEFPQQDHPMYLAGYGKMNMVHLTIGEPKNPLEPFEHQPIMWSEVCQGLLQ